jgi:hypothetical protein
LKKKNLQNLANLSHIFHEKSFVKVEIWRKFAIERKKPSSLVSHNKLQMDGALYCFTLAEEGT